MSFFALLKRLFRLPLEIQALRLELHAEKAKTSFYRHIIGTQDIVIRRTLHLLTLVDSMANDQSPRGVDEMTNSLVDPPHRLPGDLTEEFYQLSPFLQQYIVSLASETEANVTSTSSPDPRYRRPKKAGTTSNFPSPYH